MINIEVIAIVALALAIVNSIIVVKLYISVEFMLDINKMNEERFKYITSSIRSTGTWMAEHTKKHKQHELIEKSNRIVRYNSDV